MEPNLLPVNLPPSPPARILLADNADIGDDVKHLLSQRYEVERVSPPGLISAAIAQHLPELVLIDVRMLGREGLELLQQLRANPHTREIRIVLLSARAEEEVCIEGLDAGADDYLLKPFSAGELLTRIEVNRKMAQLRQQAARREQELQVQAQTAQEQMSNILESIADAFISFDRQWRYTYVNQKAAQLLQKTPNELLGQCAWEIFPEAVGTLFERELKRSLTEQVSVELEEFYPAFNTWVEVHAYASDEGLAVYFRDITERKRSQQRQQVQYGIARVLAEATTFVEAVPEILRSLCESLGGQLGTIWYLDHQHQVLRCAHNWHQPDLNIKEFLEVTQSTTFTLGVGLPGRIWANTQPAWIEDLSKEDNFPRAELAHQAGFYTTFGFPIRLGGELLGVIECFSDSVQKPDEDLLEMMAAIGTQIGQFMEHKRTEEALRESQKLFESFMKHSPVTAYIKDEAGRFIYVNALLERLFNRPSVDWVGKTDFDFFPVEMAQQYRNNDVAVLTTNQAIQRLETALLDDGEHYYMSFKFPIQDASGRQLLAGMSLDVTQAKQNEIALRESEQRYRSLVMASSQIVWRANAQGQFVELQGWEEFTGQPAQAMLIQGCRDAIHPDDWEWMTQAWWNAVATKSTYEVEHRIRKHDGTFEYFAVRGVPVFDDQGQVSAWVGMSTNINSHKQAEEALRLNRERLDLVLEAAQLGLWYCDLPFDHLNWNDKCKELFGLQPDAEVTINTFYERLHPDDRERTRLAIEQAIAQQTLYDIDYRTLAPDGRVRWIRATGRGFYDHEGNPTRFDGITLDITERKQLELALRQSESQFRSIFESNMMAMGLCHIKGDVPVANDALLELLGYTREEFVAQGLRLPDFCPSDFAHLDEQATQEALEFGVCTPYEKEFMRKDGSRVPVLGGGGTFDAESGVFFAINLTERKRAEQAQQYLTEASQVLYSSLDYQTTLASIAQLTVPRLADWCTVHLIEEDGSVQSLATAHVNPDKIAWAHKINEKYPFDPNAPQGAAQVLRTGQSELYPDIPDYLLVEAARDEEHLQILREVGFKSVMIVPLLARGRTVGTISFIAAESGRRYDQSDLALAEELARRAGLAVDNARLYRQAQQARQVAEQAAERTARLQKVTAALGEALTPQQVTEVVIKQGIEALGSRAGLVALLDENNTFLEIVGAFGYPQEMVDAWQRFPITAPLPLAQAVRTKKPIFLESAAAVILNYPQVADVVPATGNQAIVAIPLVVEGQTLGGLGISFSETQVFSKEDQGLILTLAQQCAQAIARAHLYEAEQRARAQSEAARQDSEAANRIKDEFLAVLSHELRSPLNPILGWVKLLRSRRFDAKATDRALETIERNAKLQTQLIDDLLDVSRILRGKMVLNVAPVNLVTTIEAALETVNLAAQAKQITIETVLDASVGQISGDFNRLQQVVWNLLSNAVKFTPSGGRIEVRLEKVEVPTAWRKGKGKRKKVLEENFNSHSNPFLGEEAIPPQFNTDDGETSEPIVEGLENYLQDFPQVQVKCLHPSTQYVQIQVKDTGKGIAKEFLPHVFEYFRQENSATTRQFGGLGLGLAIVRYLVELHGGSVTAASPGDGLGATFTVQLPLMRATPPEISHDQVSCSISADLSGLRVLVVDDELDIRELVVFILEQSGAEVISAASAQEGLILFNELVPDVLLCDIGMPEVDGYMLMRQIRALSPQQGGQVKAIALTAYAGEYHQQQALQAGFQLHVSKPVEPEALVRAIAHLVGRI